MSISEKLERASIDPNRLVLVESADGRPLKLDVGARVRLRSGGPPALVVDVVGENVTIAWVVGTDAEEASFNAKCLDQIA
ncbi:MAG TPA: hypothetical protein VKU90_02130 [Caulobacteraceae bacterium]|nr:hypothetical protein [Caulobacteraceae bacterium]